MTVGMPLFSGTLRCDESNVEKMKGKAFLAQLKKTVEEDIQDRVIVEYGCRSLPPDAVIEDTFTFKVAGPDGQEQAVAVLNRPDFSLVSAFHNSNLLKHIKLIGNALL